MNIEKLIDRSALGLFTIMIISLISWVIYLFIDIFYPRVANSPFIIFVIGAIFLFAYILGYIEEKYLF